MKVSPSETPVFPSLDKRELSVVAWTMTLSSHIVDLSRLLSFISYILRATVYFPSFTSNSFRNSEAMFSEACLTRQAQDDLKGVLR